MIQRFFYVSIVLLTAFSLFQEQAVAAESTFYYRVRIPAGDLTCQQEAEKLSERLSLISGLPAAETSCSGTFTFTDNEGSYSIHSVILSYVSQKALNPYTVLYGESAYETPTATYGVYSSFKDCLSDIKTRTSEYERNTGFRAFYSTCQEGSLLAKSFVLRVEGFSKDPKAEPKLRLFAYTPQIFRESTSFSTSITDFITKLGGIDVLKKQRTTFYYSKNPLKINYDKFGTFSQVSDCEMQLQDVGLIYSKLESKLTMTACSKRNGTTDRFELEAISDKTPAYIFGNNMSYFSLAECFSDKPRVIKEYANSSPKPLAAICSSKPNNQFEMQLYGMYHFKL